MRDRIDALESSQGALLAEVARLTAAIGRAPDPFAATEEARRGSGLTGVTYRIASVVLRGESALHGSTDEIGEVTQVQTRDELIARAKAAEAALRERERISTAARASRAKLAGTVAGVILALASLAANVYLVSHGQAPIPAQQAPIQP